jgi:(p)ppGpp synthase/HD superfamily hydrolase
MKATIQEAIDFAREKHKGKLDDEGKDYFEAHCCQVAELAKILRPTDTEFIQAAYLHDVLEDTDTTNGELAKMFGQRVSGLVLAVTHEGEKKTGYFFPRLIATLKNKDAFILKLLDRASNLSRMSAWPLERQLQYLKKSIFWKVKRE